MLVRDGFGHGNVAPMFFENQRRDFGAANAGATCIKPGVDAVVATSVPTTIGLWRRRNRCLCDGHGGKKNCCSKEKQRPIHEPSDPAIKQIKTMARRNAVIPAAKEGITAFLNIPVIV